MALQVFRAWPVLFILFTAAYPAEGRDQDLPDTLAVLDRQISDLWRAGRYDEAGQVAQYYAESARRQYGEHHVHFAATQGWLGTLAHSQGRTLEAHRLHERQLAILERHWGPNSSELVSALDSLAYVSSELARYEAAEAYLTRALRIAEGTPGFPQDELGSLLDGLGEVHRARDHLDRAEPVLRRALEIREKELGANSPYVAQTLSRLALILKTLGRLDEAETLYVRYVAVYEKALGPKHPDFASALGNLAGFYQDRGRVQEAEALYRRSLAIREEALGPEHPDVGTAVNGLGLLELEAGHFAEAEPLLTRALQIKSKTLGSEHPDVASAMNNLAGLYSSMGRYDEAELHFRRALDLRRRVLPEGHTDIAWSLSNLAGHYRDLGQLEAAEPLAKQALAMFEASLGTESPDTASMVNNLAALYDQMNRRAEALPLYQRALGIREKVLGNRHPLVADSLNNIAIVLEDLDRLSEAEPLLERALSIREEVYGAQHPLYAQSLNNLGTYYDRINRPDLAESYLLRALESDERVFGPAHEEVAMALNNLAEHYREAGKFDTAIPLYERAIAIGASRSGPDSPKLAISLANLAYGYFDQGQWEAAADWLRESLDITVRRASRGTIDSGKATSAAEVRGAERHQNLFWRLIKAIYRQAEASGHFTEFAPEAFKASQWATYSDAARSLSRMALRSASGSPELATYIRERQDLVGEWLTKDRELVQRKSEKADRRNIAEEEKLNSRLSGIDLRLAEIDAVLTRDFPGYAALAASSPVSLPEAQALLRDDEALVHFLHLPARGPTPEETFIFAVTRSAFRWTRIDVGPSLIGTLVIRLRCGLDRAGSWEWSPHASRYFARSITCAELAPEGLRRNEPLPFDVATARLLEHALFGTIGDLIEGKHLLLVPSGALTSLPLSVLVKPPKSPPEFPSSRVVASLGGYFQTISEPQRRDLGLKPGLGTLITSIDAGGPAEAAGIKAGDVLLSIDGREVGRFDEAIFVLRSKPPGSSVSLAVRRDGRDTELTARLGQRTIADWKFDVLNLASSASLDWLIERHALTVLPSIAALRSLRTAAGASAAPEPFIAFADPVLSGKCGPAAMPQTCPETAGEDEVAYNFPATRDASLDATASYFRGGLAHVADLKSRLCPLPDTAFEVRCVALSLDAGEDSLVLGRDMTETALKRWPLDRYRILHLATHGLLAGETAQLARDRAEPALVMTPPDVASEEDDGLLTASEIVRLKLDADWVIMSACNTASGGAPGAEALSGLANAFFYAGARALLVSHWPVNSIAATMLTTRSFAELKQDGAIGRAEALRRSMVALIAAKNPSWAAHPSAWAPFILVGEGGAGR